MILEVHYQGPLGKVSETVDLHWEAVNRICDFIKSLSRDVGECYVAGPTLKSRVLNITPVAEERRHLIYDMIDTELAQQEEQQDEVRDEGLG